MGITSGALARDVVTAMNDEGLVFAILHRREDLLLGKVGSDVDLVVAEPPRIIVGRLGDRLRRLGLTPILFWTYDSGGTASVFLASENAEDGIQLDLLYDPEGSGKYGVRSDQLLAESASVEGWPVLKGQAEIVYLLRKRLVKGNMLEALQLRKAFLDEDRQEMKALVSRVLTPAAASSVNGFIVGHQRTRRRLRRPVSELRRLVDRLVHPIGAWVHAAGSSEVEVEEVVRRLGRFVPHTGRGIPRGFLWYWRDCAPVRWRAGIYVSWGKLQSGKAPDLVTAKVESADVLARLIVSFLSRRIDAAAA